MILSFILLVISCELNEIDTDERLLFIPTYDGSGQAVHPDILKIDKSHYYLAFTPFPYSDIKFENPSLLFSNNGIDFNPIPELENPLAGPLTGKAFCNDPDISFYDSTYYLMYQEAFPGDSQNVILLKSVDAVNWSNKKIIIHQDLKKGDNFSVSPTILRKNSIFNFFYVDITNKNVIKQMTSNSFESWDYQGSEKIDINIPDDLSPWHIDVFENAIKGEFYMLISAYKENFNYQDLYIAKSTDLKMWDLKEEPIIIHSSSFFNSRSIYRSSGLIENRNDLLIYFSFKTYSNEWQIGIKKFEIDKLF